MALKGWLQEIQAELGKAWPDRGDAEHGKAWPDRGDEYVAPACGITRTLPDSSLLAKMTSTELLFERKFRTALAQYAK